MSFNPAHDIVLPIGLEWEGQRYNNITIDAQRGTDEENVGDASIGNNGAKAMTVLFQRCVQSIEGLLDKKRGRDSLCDGDYFRKMLSPDRDFLFLSIRALDMKPDFDVEIHCPTQNCDNVQQYNVVLKELPVLEWDHDKGAPQLKIPLLHGFEAEDGETYMTAVWDVPNGFVMERLASVSSRKLVTTTLSSSIKSFEGYDGMLSSVDFKRLRTADRKLIMKTVMEETPGVDLRYDSECTKCGNAWGGEVDLTRFFNSGDAVDGQMNSSGRSGRKKGGKRLRKRSRSLRKGGSGRKKK